MRVRIAILTTAWVLTACEHQQDLCMNHQDHERREVEVFFDWSDCPDANPATMSLYLFPADGSHFTRHEFIGRSGGKILVVPGVYSAVAVNSDNNNIKITNPGYADGFMLSLRDVYDAQGLSREGERLSIAPDSLWAAWSSDIVIRDGRFIVNMREILSNYTLEIHHLANSHLVRSIDVTLSSMNASLGFGGGVGDSTTARILFNINTIASEHVVGEFHTLGHCGLTRSRGDPAEHKLGIYFTLGDGSVRYRSVDVTDQIHSQPVERCLIVIDTLDVPLTPTGGVNLSVDDWEVTDIIVKPN